MKSEKTQEVGGNAEQVAGGNIVSIKSGARVNQVAGGHIVNLTSGPSIASHFSRDCSYCNRFDQLHGQVCLSCAFHILQRDLQSQHKQQVRKALRIGFVGAGCVIAAQLGLPASVAWFFLGAGVIALLQAERLLSS